MMYYTKKKIKLSLIEDYILICLVNNFYLNSFNSLADEIRSLFEQTKQLNSQLKDTYELMFNKLKMNDLSLLILKKELKENNSLYKISKLQNFANIATTIESFNEKLTNILNNLPSKTTKLKLKV